MKRLAFAGICALTLSGCIYIDGDHDGWRDNWQSEQRKNREMINELALSTARSDVLTRMGTPDFTEAFKRDDDVYRVLYYRTHRRHSDGDTSKDETTPLIFKNDVLIGWGHSELSNLKL